MTNERFARAAFQTSSRPDDLAAELSMLLTTELEQNPTYEGAKAIANALNALGHAMRLVDEDGSSFALWHAAFDGNASTLTCHYPDVTDHGEQVVTNAQFSFCPIPPPAEPKLCVDCATAMIADAWVIHVAGHGSVQYESLPYKVSIGPNYQREGLIRNQILHIQESVLRCPRCGGVWFPARRDGA